MRKLLTALSFGALTIAALTVTPSGIARTQSDFLTSAVWFAHAHRVHGGSLVQQVGGGRTGNDTLINHPEPRGAGTGY